MPTAKPLRGLQDTQHYFNVVSNPQRKALIQEAAVGKHMSVERYLKYVNFHVNRIVSTSRVCINMSEKNFASFLNEGRYYTHTDGKYSGSSYEGFDFTLTHLFSRKPGSRGPVFGYLVPQNRLNEFSSKVEAETRSMYGSVRMVLKNAVRPHATFSFGDYEYTNYEGWDEYSDSSAANVALPLTKPNQLAYDFCANAPGSVLDDGTCGNPNMLLHKMDASNLHSGIQYVEAHVWRRVAPKDVEIVCYDGDMDTLLKEYDLKNFKFY